MATVGRLNNASTPNTSRRSYISTAEFDGDFYSYTVETVDRETIGTIGPVVGATCSKCPAGRILRETGRKLYPGANPGVDKYYVGVYDSVSFLNGFIDPNANVFAVYNSDKPTYIPNNSDSSSVLGAPVVTSGDVISTEGFVGIYANIKNKDVYAGQYLDEEGDTIVQAATTRPENCDDITFLQSTTYATLYPSGEIESINDDNNTFVRLTADGNIVNTGNTTTSSIVTAAKYNVSPASTSSASAGKAAFDGVGSVTITTSAVTSNSFVFINVKGSGAIYSAVEPANGNFVVTPNTNTSAEFYWLIIN